MKYEIIIPTVGGRAKYLKWAIKSCLNQNGMNCSVLVSNNGGSEDIRLCVEEVGDARVKYIQTDEYLHMAEHWEFALSHASGDVICILGDDDALMPDALNRVDAAFNQYPGIECVSHRPAQYYWPDYLEESLQNKFSVFEDSGIVELVDAKEVFKDVAEFRKWYGFLPILYHGFVSLKLLNRLKERDGRVFARIAPDIYSDLVIALNIDKFIRISDYLTIGGQGAKSNGVNCKLGTKEGKKFSANIPDSLIPRYSIYSIVLQVYDYVEYLSERYDFLSQIKLNGYKMIPMIIRDALRSPQYFDEIMDDFKKIIEKDFSIINKAAALIAIGICRPMFVKKLFLFMLNQRQSNIQYDRDAKALFGASNVYELTLAKLSDHDSDITLAD